MTAFLRGKAVSQTDMILIDGKYYGEVEMKEFLKVLKGSDKPIKKGGKK